MPYAQVTPSQPERPACHRRQRERLARSSADREYFLGNYSYCHYNGRPCRPYEGHCKNDGDCGAFLGQCARGAGAKYGLPDGSAVCIPKYDQNQVAFWPTLMFNGQPTSMLFMERGILGKLPQTAHVRILRGTPVLHSTSSSLCAHTATVV